MKFLIGVFYIIVFVFVLNAQQQKTVDSTAKVKIEIKNDALKKVIEEFVDDLQLKQEHNVLTLQLQRIEDTYIAQIGRIFSIMDIYLTPPSHYAICNNNYILIYNGFEEFYKFSDEYKDEIAKIFFPKQFAEYKKNGQFPWTALHSESYWKVKIRNNEIIWLQKIVLEPLYWK